MYRRPPRATRPATRFPSPPLFRSLIFAFGGCFLLPVLLMLLARAGIVTVEQLRSFRRYAIVAAFAVAAVLTPPDVVSQLLLALPLVADRKSTRLNSSH